MNPALTMRDIEVLTGGRLGVFDLACPVCGPGRRQHHNQTRKVLRVWRKESAFASFKCARCGIEGGVADKRRSNIVAVRQRPAEGDHSERQAAKANALWRRRRPAVASPVETYLRDARHYAGPIPATIGFLPAGKPDHHPAMIAAFGLADEPEPGVLAVGETARGVHLTLLRADGRSKAGTDRDKLMVGPSSGLPIVLAQPNDSLGLIVCEGIESGLSLFEATGCGVWAAGAAGRMPTLGDEVPDWIDTVTIAAEADEAGRKGAFALAERLKHRGIHCELRFLGENREAA